MSGCDSRCETLSLEDRKQSRVLVVVLWINALMFFVVVWGAFYSGSISLLSSSVDNLGDAITYGLSLYAVGKSPLLKAKVAFLKGLLILIAAFIVSFQIILKILVPFVPIFTWMGTFSLLSLLANFSCLMLLNPIRKTDINMSSVWECARNDVFENLTVLIAAVLVWIFHSQWPDLILAFLFVLFLYRSAWRILIKSWRQIKTNLSLGGNVT